MLGMMVNPERIKELVTSGEQTADDIVRSGLRMAEDFWGRIYTALAEVDPKYKGLV